MEEQKDSLKDKNNSHEDRRIHQRVRGKWRRTRETVEDQRDGSTEDKRVCLLVDKDTSEDQRSCSQEDQRDIATVHSKTFNDYQT